MNISIIVHRKYIHQLKANIIRFWLMYIFSMYDDRKGISGDDEHHQIHQIIQFFNAMNVTVVVHQIYIDRSKANIIGFWSIYIFFIYDDGNIHYVDKLYLTFLMHTQKNNISYFEIFIWVDIEKKSPNEIYIAHSGYINVFFSYKFYILIKAYITTKIYIRTSNPP